MKASIPYHAKSRRWKVAAIMATAVWFLAFPALLVVWIVDVESIIVSGPFLLVIALAAVICALIAKSKPFILVATVEAAMPVVIFLMIYLGHIGPARAYGPVTLAAIVYLVGMIPLLTIAWLSRDRTKELWRCAQCNYALIGLTSARCPECGTPFDPAVVESALAEGGRGAFPLEVAPGT